MTTQQIILGDSVSSIKWVNAGTEYPVDKLYLDGESIWPPPNYAKSISVKGFKYRSSGAYNSLLAYLPYDFNNSGWEGNGEPWPRDADYLSINNMISARGTRPEGLKCFYYNVDTGAISASSTPAEIQAAMDVTKKWTVIAPGIPANVIPFTYGSTKGMFAYNYKKSLGAKEDNLWGEENEGINGEYRPVFFNPARTAVTTAKEARDYILYQKKPKGISTRRSNKYGGPYFADRILDKDDFFTGIYAETTSKGRYIIVGVYYPDFSEAGLGDGKDFRFELRASLYTDSKQYKFDSSLSSSSKRKALFEHNVYFDNELTAPDGNKEIKKTVNMGLYGPPILWTTDNFTDANDSTYGPVKSTFSWEIPVDQQPHYNESFRWKKEGESWSVDRVNKTYWNHTLIDSIKTDLDRIQTGFETSDLDITATQV